MTGIGIVVLSLINNQITHPLLKERLLAAPLTDLAKGEPQDGTGHRPIAPGEIFYRLATRYTLSAVPAHVYEKLFKNIQYGIKKQAGCERALHIIRERFEHYENSGMIIKIDMENAFNTVARSFIAEQLFGNEDLKVLWGLFTFAYGTSSKLYIYRNGIAFDTLDSVEGVRQGDALGSFLFDLAVQCIFEKCMVGKARITAATDDATITGPISDAIATYVKLKEELASIGLKLSAAKCAAMHYGSVPPSDFIRSCDQHGIPRVDRMKILGCMLSNSEQVVREWAESKLEGIKDELAVIQHKQMPLQVAMLILRTSISAKMDYLMRVLSPDIMLPILHRFDEMMVDAVRTLIDQPWLHVRQRERIQLNIKNGGLGILQRAPIAHIAFYASLVLAAPDVAQFYKSIRRSPDTSKFHRALAEVEDYLNITLNMDTVSMAAVPPIAPVDPRTESLWRVVERKVAQARTDAHKHVGHRHLQRELSKHLHDGKAKELFNALAPEEKAAMLSSRQPNASLWLTAVPTEDNYKLNNFEMESSIRMRLHLQPKNITGLRTTVCHCTKEQSCDLLQDPTHFQSCPTIEGRHARRRHDLVVKTLKDIARELSVSCEVEERSFEVPDDQKKPDLRFTLPNHNVVSLISDVAITHPATHARAARNGAASSAVTALHAAKEYEVLKSTKYRAENNRRAGSKFVPFVLESYGAWGKCASQVLYMLMKHADDRDREERTIDARIRISVALQRGNALIHRAGIQYLESDFDCSRAYVMRAVRHNL